MKVEVKFLKFIPAIWLVCLGLNLLIFFDKFSVKFGAFISLFWFFLSFCLIMLIYKISFKNLVLKVIILVLVGFLGGYFTSFLYFGISDANALYMGIFSCIISVSFALGVGVIL